MRNKVPILSESSWFTTVPQIFSLVISIIFVYLVIKPGGIAPSLVIGAAIYLSYSITSRRILASAHNRGMRLTKLEKFKEAIPNYEQSYQFFTKHKWIDEYRCIILMNPSVISYREMALVNIAFCYGQLGDGALAKDYYEKTLDEFPDSASAKASLNMIETIQKETS